MPLYTSLFQELSQVQPKELSNYYLVFHQKKGFQLQRKHISKNSFINAVVDPIFRAIKSWMGYSYNFEASINNFSRLVKKDAATIEDFDGCISSCNKLSMIAERVFKKKHRDSSAIVNQLSSVKLALIRKKAEAEGVNPVDYACRLDAMAEAVLLFCEKSNGKIISQESRDKLLPIFLDNQDYARAKNLIRAGANPMLQTKRLFTHIEQMVSVLDSYFVIKPQTLVDKATDFDILSSVMVPFFKSIHYYPRALKEHNLELLVDYFEANWQKIDDVKGCISLLYRFSRAGVNSQVEIILSDFIQKKSEQLGVTALELAISLELNDLAFDLYNQGADIALLSQDAKNTFFELCLQTQLEVARQLFIVGAEAEDPESLRNLLHYTIEKEDDELACRLLDAKAPRGPSRPKGDDTALFRAVKHGSIAVVEKLLSLGEDLDKRVVFERNVLSIAAQNRQIEMLEWLVSRVDVTNSAGAFSHLAKHSWLLEKDPVEREFLLGNFTRCQELLAKCSEEDAKKFIADLRAAYPVSCVDHILYSVTNHFQNHVSVPLPEAVAPKVKLNELLGFFDAMNFTDPNAEHYINPSEYTIDTETSDVALLREGLLKFINNITYRVAFIGTPKPGESLEVFYNAMERAVSHTIKLLNEMKESEEKTKLKNFVMVQFLRAAFYCGGKQYATACQQYVTVKTGIVPTFEQEIYDMLATYREVLFSSFVPKGNQSVHDYNKMMQHLGVELGIPGGEMMAKFEDAYGKHILNYEQIKKGFLELYNTRNILFECVRQRIEPSAPMRDKLFDWFKKNVPEEWIDAFFVDIEQELEARETREEKVAYLETKNITVLDDEDIEKAVQDFRDDEASIGYAYLGLEVVEDMKAEKMRIKPAALAYMLHKMKILNPVYDWSYLDVSKQALSRAWKGAKSYFVALFGR
ncbi:MAG: ankyrin repeat domain-containing protein [Verrucomicrobia bacterium]|nr:ankyrin repeat domain-containing protein [Verrucomicrobiota bacterium]